MKTLSEKITYLKKWSTEIEMTTGGFHPGMDLEQMTVTDKFSHSGFRFIKLPSHEANTYFAQVNLRSAKILVKVFEEIPNEKKKYSFDPASFIEDRTFCFVGYNLDELLDEVVQYFEEREGKFLVIPKDDPYGRKLRSKDGR